MGLFTFRWILSLVSIFVGLAVVDMAFKHGAFGPQVKEKLKTLFPRGESEVMKALNELREEFAEMRSEIKEEFKEVEARLSSLEDKEEQQQA